MGCGSSKAVIAVAPWHFSVPPAPAVHETAMPPTQKPTRTASGGGVTCPPAGDVPVLPSLEVTIESAISFLTEKGVFGKEPEFRIMRFGYLRDPSSAPSGLQREYKKHRSVALKLMSLLVNGEKVQAKPPVEEQLDLTAFAGFSLHGVFAGRSADLVQRHQQSTTCKEHAVDVIEQYATYFAQLSNDPQAVLLPRMLDMATQFRSASPEVLGRHVFWIGDTMRSENLLREVLEPGSVVIASSHYEESLVNYGPGLITSFRVYQDFKDKTIKCHTGPPTGTYKNKFGKERRHAMVLLAVRTDSAGKRFFLVQNFWLGKQFVEIDEVYFQACRGAVFFVKTRQPLVPREVAARSNGAWVEADGGSSPDSQGDD